MFNSKAKGAGCLKQLLEAQKSFSLDRIGFTVFIFITLNTFMIENSVL